MRAVIAGEMKRELENSMEAGNQSERSAGKKQNSPKNSENYKAREMEQATVCGMRLR